MCLDKQTCIRSNLKAIIDEAMTPNGRPLYTCHVSLPDGNVHNIASLGDTTGCSSDIPDISLSKSMDRACGIVHSLQKGRETVRISWHLSSIKACLYHHQKQLSGKEKPHLMKSLRSKHPSSFPFMASTNIAMGHLQVRTFKAFPPTSVHTASQTKYETRCLFPHTLHATRYAKTSNLIGCSIVRSHTFPSDGFRFMISHSYLTSNNDREQIG